MRPWNYRLMVIGSALAWFMVGLHVPIFHEMTDHGGTVSTSVMVIVALLIVAAVAGLWALLRLPARWSGADGAGTREA